MNTVDIKVSFVDLQKSDLSLLEYLFLGYLVYFNNKSTEELFKGEDIVGTGQITMLLKNLSDKGYIRVISTIIHINDKGNNLFFKKYAKEAKEILMHFNMLKSKYLGINRNTVASKYTTKLKSLLSEGHDVEFVKEVFQYCVSTWKDDLFWQNHIDIETICRHFEKYADQYLMSQNKDSDSNINTML